MGALRWRRAVLALALGAATFGLQANLTILSQFDDICRRADSARIVGNPSEIHHMGPVKTNRLYSDSGPI